MGNLRGDNHLTVLSAFTGAGGLDVGLEAAGFETVGCIEVDATCRETLARNRPNWRILEPGDIGSLSKRLHPHQLGLGVSELTLLAGGPPCQPFSKAAQWSENGNAGIRDRRSRCLRGFLSLVETFLPKVVLIENVGGFITGRNGALPTLTRAFRKINHRHHANYTLVTRLVDAADYGVPQHRVRAILIAFREDTEFSWPTATHANSPITAWDALHRIKNGATSTSDAYWFDLLRAIPEGHNYLYHTDRGSGLPLFGYRTRYWSFLLKLAKTRPAWTIPAQPGPYTGPFHWDNRPLTIPELLRLQSFPLNWHVAGNRRQQIRQIGNATPPLLMEQLGRAIAQSLLPVRYEVQPRLRIRRCSTPPPASKTYPVDEKYLVHIGSHRQHPGTGRGPSPRLKQ